jgi:hypothetical protein
MIIWAMKKGCTDGRRDQLRKQFHGREGEVTRGSSCRRGNRVFLGLRQEFLLSGFSDEGKRVKRIQVCGVREHVNRKSVNNKKDKTLFKASKTI